jgi:hypothetical protein
VFDHHYMHSRYPLSGRPVLALVISRNCNKDIHSTSYKTIDNSPDVLVTFRHTHRPVITQSLAFCEDEASVAPAEANTTVLRSFTFVTRYSVSMVAHNPDATHDVPKRTLLPSFHISVTNVSPG